MMPTYAVQWEAMRAAARAGCRDYDLWGMPPENDPDHPVSVGERYALKYEINMIRCIFCGFCEEACPVEAIRLGPEYELSDYDRHSLVYTKEMLLDPEQYAPRRQFHPDVDKPRGPIGGLPDDEAAVSGVHPQHQESPSGAREPVQTEI